MRTPLRSLVLCGENRRDMEEWLNTLRTSEGDPRPQGDPGTAELLGGNHQWYATSHARPTYCNVCRDALHGKQLFFFHCKLNLPSYLEVAMVVINLRHCVLCYRCYFPRFKLRSL